MNLVFDFQLIEKLKASYNNRPKYQWPELYNLAIDPDWEEERREIESRVAMLTDKDRQTLIEQLRNPKLFLTTYNELAVGVLLIKCGHQVEYEKPIIKKTPDWYVIPNNTSNSFIVEVASILPTKKLQSEMQSWAELRYRLGKIEHYFHLMLSSTSRSALSGKKISRIVKFVEEWLNKFDPEDTKQMHDNIYEDDDLQITVTLMPRETKHKKAVEVGGPIFTEWINVELLRDTISKKLKKYREVKKMKIPLVVAVIPAFESGFSESSLLDALFGQEQMFFPKTDYEIVRTQMTRDRRGIISPRLQKGEHVVLNTTLSAVFWVSNARKASAKIIHNPNAHNPISPQIFPSFPNLVVAHSDQNSLELKWMIP